MLLGLGLALAACGATPQDPAAGGQDATVQTQAAGPSGSLDTSFGGDGRVTLSMREGNRLPAALQVLSGGRLLVGSSAYGGIGSEFALDRLLADGSRDPAWNGGHSVTTQFVQNDFLYGLDLQSDGKVVAVGSASDGTSPDRQIALARYTSAGAPDSSFGNGGTTLLNFASDDDFEKGEGVWALSSGKLLLAGDSGGKFFVARLLQNGALDPAFGTGGRALLDPGEPVTSFAAGFRNGAVVLAGAGAQVHVARILAGGTPDANFGTGGLTTLPFAYTDGGALAIQSDDRIVLAANVPDADDNDQAQIVRVKENGSLDRSFGTNGTISQPFGTANAQVNDLHILDADDTFVAGGGFTTADGSWGGYTLARYHMNGRPDQTFGSGGVTMVGNNAVVDRVALTGGRIFAAGQRTPSRRVLNGQVLEFFR